MNTSSEHEKLSDQEIQLLASIMANKYNNESSVSKQNICDEFEIAGYTVLATSITLINLTKKEMIELIEEEDTFGNEKGICRYLLTSKGKHWILENEDQLHNLGLMQI